MRIDLQGLTRKLSLVAMLLSLSLVAANASARSYAIEMIIFSNADDYERGTESWRAEPGLPDTTRATPVAAGGAVTAVNRGAYRLSGAWQALRNSSQYRPLRHLAWIQRGRPKRLAPEILVGEDANSDVFGTVQVSRARFLHLNMDLLLRDAAGSYRFTNHRRMRSNELHYIDHPMFGVLVIATPL